MRIDHAFGTTMVGDILRRTLATYRAHFFLFVSLSAVIYIPYYLFLAAVPWGRSLPAMAGAIVPGIVAQALASAMVIWVIIRTALGYEVGLVNVLGSLTPSLVVKLLGTILMVTVAVSSAFLLLILPGLVLLVWLSLVNQVVVVERMAYLPAVRRSLQIIRGSWWQVLSVLLGLVLINLTALLVIGSLFGDDAAWPGQLFGILFVPFWSISLTLLYFDLRTAKEGFAMASLEGGPGMSREEDHSSPW
ncbi:MAG: hypothetical protein V1800_03660 [Candidatus Latescibacterota bacterium]